ncbi:MAG: ATP synthase F1 subunit delta [Acidobacteriaceae bacterium]
MSLFASRYARAFADVVMDQRLDPNQVASQLKELVGLVDGSADLKNVWENPGVPADQKVKLLDAIAAREDMTKYVRNFIAVLIEHHRMGALGEIVRQFIAEMDARMGFAEAAITSARELRRDERRALEAEVAKATGKQVRAVYAEDKALIGGAVVRVGSTIFDGSVRGQLARIKELLAAG